MYSIKLYVECNRGEGSMIFDLNTTCLQAMQKIAEWYGFRLAPDDRPVLQCRRRGKVINLDPLMKLDDLNLWHEENVWFDVLTDE